MYRFDVTINGNGPWVICVNRPTQKQARAYMDAHYPLAVINSTTKIEFEQ